MQQVIPAIVSLDFKDIIAINLYLGKWLGVAGIWNIFLEALESCIG